MNRSIKRVAAAALAIIMVAGYAPATFNGLRLFDTTITASAEPIGTWTSGSCTLTLDDTGTLTVSGNGAMDNYTDEFGDKTVPWYDVRNSVTSVVISDGVTKIGDYAFYNFNILTSLSIADTVTNIGEWAFGNCGSLNTIAIPSSITSIGSFAFYSSAVDRIRKVTFIRPESERSLTVANSAFQYSAKLFYSDGGNYSLFEDDTEMELTGESYKGDKLNGKTLTWKLPIFSITDNSVNGSVTASVDGSNVTEAEVGDTVTLTVKPDTGYKLKTISISTSKEKVEEFSDLVSLMGTAVFAGEGDNGYTDFSEYTCKVEDDKFVVYNGTTLVAETANISDFNVGSYGVSFYCGDIYWGFDISDNKITRIMLSDTSDNWNSLFNSAYPSESNGTLPPFNVELTTVTEGSKYSFTMPKKNVTVKAEFEEGAEPQIAPTYQLILPNDLTYNGEAQDLVTSDNGEGGAIHYVYRKSGDTAWTAVASGYPQVKDAGTYEVGWYSEESDDYLAAGSALVPNIAGTVTIAKKAITITADDKSSQYGSDIAELTYLVTSTGFIVSDDLGVKLNTTATSASDVGEYEITVDWNGNPNFDATLENGKYTITKAPLEITASGYDAVYDGEAHSISVTYEGETDAVIYYGTEELTADNYETVGSTENPTFTNAGEYTVYFYIVSNNYEADPISGSKVVNIRKDRPEYEVGVNSELIYTGEELELVDSAEANGGTIVYALSDSADTAPDDEAFSETRPTAKDVGTYYVWFKVIGDENHTDSEPECLEAAIIEPEASKTDISKGTVTVNAADKAVTVTVDGKTVPASEYHVIYFTYEKTADGESLTRVGTEFPTEPGTYIAAVVANEDSETYIGENRSEPFTIAAPDSSTPDSSKPDESTPDSSTPESTPDSSKPSNTDNGSTSNPATGAAAGMGAIALAAAAVVAAKKKK